MERSAISEFRGYVANNLVYAFEFKMDDSTLSKFGKTEGTVATEWEPLVGPIVGFH